LDLVLALTRVSLSSPTFGILKGIKPPPPVPDETVEFADELRFVTGLEVTPVFGEKLIPFLSRGPPGITGYFPALDVVVVVAAVGVVGETKRPSDWSSSIKIIKISPNC